MNMHTISMLRFRGQVAISTETAEHLDLPKEAKPWPHRPERVTVELSNPDNSAKDIGFVAQYLIANRIPFAWKPSPQEDFQHAADHKIDDVGAVVTHIQEGKAFHWEFKPDKKEP